MNMTPEDQLPHYRYRRKILVYKGNLFYSKGRGSERKKRNVTLEEMKNGDSLLHYKLVDVKFKPEELCFLEKDEWEFKVPASTHHLCGPLQKPWQRKCFHTLCVLTYNTAKHKSVIQQFYEESSCGDRYQRKVAKLKRQLEAAMGSCYSWFVDAVGDGYPNDTHKLRLIVTSNNVCLLDHDLQLLQFHVLHKDEPNLSTFYDEESRVLEMKFREGQWNDGNFQTVKTIKLRTGLGGDIKHQVDQMLALERPGMRQKDILRWIIATTVGDIEPDESESESSDLPPPTPHLCANSPAPYLPHMRQAVEHDDRTLSDFTVLKTLAPVRCPMVRAESMNDLYLSPCHRYKNYVYNNEEYRRAHSRTGHEDGSYYSIYYCNQGWVQCHRPPSLGEKLKRRSHLSTEIGDVDLTAVKRHEQWFDQGFKRRSFDKVYSRLEDTRAKQVWSPVEQCPLNIPVDAVPMCDTHEDLYWNTDLCLCIHKIFEEKTGKTELMNVFDLTWEQMIAIFIHLDVHMSTRANDWKDFGAFLELTWKDTEIIKHFCYTYREWPMFIILSYWRLLETKSQNVPSCSYDNLRHVIERMERLDILRILRARNMNEQIQIAGENECTHF